MEFGLSEYVSVEISKKSYLITSLSEDIKDFLKDNKASIAINISDIFHIQNFRVNSIGNNFEGNVKRQWETTIANIVFTYKFGKDVKTNTPKKKGDDGGSGVDGGGF